LTADGLLPVHVHSLAFHGDGLTDERLRSTRQSEQIS
jgi:hypothetical protein